MDMPRYGINPITNNQLLRRKVHVTFELPQIQSKLLAQDSRARRSPRAAVGETPFQINFLNDVVTVAIAAPSYI